MKHSKVISICIGMLVITGVVIVACRFGKSELKSQGTIDINALEQVELGGVKQWISIRGTDIENPLLLFLHGGPGSASLSKLRNQCPELEKQFVVVNWDQRGAGKSYHPWQSQSSLTLDQLRKDTHELVELLRKRYGGRKIYLMGFSWGTVLGLLTVHDYPEDFIAYIGVSQVVNYKEGERLSLAFVQDAAKKANNQMASKELANIDPEYRSGDWYAQLMRQRRWLLAFGGVYYTASNYNHEVWMLLKAREYSLVDFALWPIGSSKSLRTLWPELMDIDLSMSVRSIEVPAFFFAGRHDYNAPFDLTAAFFDGLKATQGKELVWFESSAHDLFYDQPKEVVKELMRIKGK